MSRLTIVAPPRLRGCLTVPGDKSISHRAVILNAVAHGSARVTNFLTGEDCLSTIACLQALGAQISRDDTSVVIEGVGLRGLHEPTDVLNCGNSGTTLRLLAGLLAGLPLFAVLTGDASLRARPQRRIVEPLRALGAMLDGRGAGNYAPLAVRGAPLHGGTYDLPIASAQVKSALMLAALSGDGPLNLTGLIDSRDHTERMLDAMGVNVQCGPPGIILLPPGYTDQPDYPAALSLRIPGDPSSAAFWWVAAAIHPNAEITTPGICLNPTRTGALDVLRAMGADISIHNEHLDGSEPVGDVMVRSSALRGTTIDRTLIPRLIDEVPVLALAAVCAEGETVIRDAQELRVKETDRISTVVESLRALGAAVEDQPDGMIIAGSSGGPLRGALLPSQGDHRLAMTWGIAALVAQGETTIVEPQAASVSYPGFWEHLTTLTDK